jgi:hypothetical protein
MRLLKIEASGEFSLHELNSDKMQPYAILSHVWGDKDQEVTFRDLIDKTGERKVGYDKIEFCAKQAKEDGIEYFWVDTCCIDKSSSAELSEAINSMYHWYEEATTCYAYLSDVYHPEGNHSHDHKTFPLSESKWFKRGWTLQELIAPSKVVFYSKEWKCLGTKSELIEELKEITGIDGRVLGGDHPSVCSIADRMSWASKRTTTRDEDIAYSLLGIFDINMPLLYGERDKAFIRLQEEIMKASDDQSIFAWKSSDSSFHTGLLATSPKHFDTSGSIISPGFSDEREPSSVTSRGICATFDLEPNLAEHGTHFARLACHPLKDDHQYAIVLQCIQGTQYIRIKPDVLEARKLIGGWRNSKQKKVHVRQNLFQPLQQSRFPSSANAQDGIGWFWIRGTKDLLFSDPVSFAAWYPEAKLFGLRPLDIGRVVVTHRGFEDRKTILLFRIWEGRPCCMLHDPANGSYDLRSWEETGLAPSDELPMREVRGTKKPNHFLTARISQVDVRSCPCMVVTVCLKTVNSQW